MAVTTGTDFACDSQYSALVDAVKAGMEIGSGCTTQEVKATGRGQATALLEVVAARAQVAEHTGVYMPLIADGGIRYTGDMVKALSAGANVVMMGSVFAGVEESPGETIIYEGRKFKQYRGMGSIGAMAD